jgi:integrase
MSLSNRTIVTLKPKADKPYRTADSHGLYIEVFPIGSKLWRWKYRFQGKEKRLALGTYPEVSLSRARELRFEAQQQLAQGLDPSQIRKDAKINAKGLESFEAVAREYLATIKATHSEGHHKRVVARMEKDAYPIIGKRAIQELKAPDMRTMLKSIMERGVGDTAKRLMQTCSQVFQYAVAHGRAEFDPTSALKKALPVTKTKHFASITDPKKLGDLLRSIEAYTGTFVVKSALRLAPLVFLRPGELRTAEWSEIDLDQGEWRIPAHKMKMGQQHIVPLSKQAIAILKEVEPYTNRKYEGRSTAPRYVFTGGHSKLKPMSNNAILTALRNMGYSKEEMTGHGFRSVASTLLHEKGWKHLAIERQLAHSEKSAVSAAYNYAEHLPERREMMQWWADYLDGLKADPRS